MNNKLTLEDLQFLKELIKELDDDKQIFKLSKDIIDINEKKLKKELDQKEGEKIR